MGGLLVWPTKESIQKVKDFPLVYKGESRKVQFGRRKDPGVLGEVLHGTAKKKAPNTRPALVHLTKPVVFYQRDLDPPNDRDSLRKLTTVPLSPVSRHRIKGPGAKKTGSQLASNNKHNRGVFCGFLLVHVIVFINEASFSRFPVRRFFKRHIQSSLWGFIFVAFLMYWISCIF